MRSNKEQNITCHLRTEDTYATNMTDHPTATQATAKRFLSRRDEIQAWFDDRTWSLRGDAATYAPQDTDVPDDECKVEQQGGRCRAKTVLFPTSTADVSAILRDLPPDTPVSVVCGGHSSSNASTAACPGAVVLDLHKLDEVTVNKELMQVTVGGGVLTRQLAEAVRDAGGALPVGTGDTVGVAGYVTNGGISGYFQKRLGMMGQRAVRMTVVLADGTVRELTKGGGSEDDQALFRAMLGAGSALGVLTSLTLQMEQDTIFRTGGNLVVACGTLESAQAYARKALTFLRDAVLPHPSVSMELVVTADFTCIVTLVFYDTFEGDPAEFAQDLREAGGDKVVVDDVTGWTTWFEAASSLWPVIAEMKGDPLFRMDHCMGTRISTSAQRRPDDAVLDFIVDNWIGRMPFEQASQSIVEIRSLGGEATSHSNAGLVPAGNAKCEFFADMIVAYDGKDKSGEKRRQIQSKVDAIVGDAKKLGGDDSSAVYVDFSATHSQPGGCGGSDVFGDDKNYETIRSVKRKVNPLNRFRCHPFGTLL